VFLESLKRKAIFIEEGVDLEITTWSRAGKNVRVERQESKIYEIM
jgi:hypothetical protein